MNLKEIAYAGTDVLIGWFGFIMIAGSIASPSAGDSMGPGQKTVVLAVCSAAYGQSIAWGNEA